MSQPFISHVAPEQAVNWSEDLETLHEESSRTHFIDVWTRRAMLVRVGPLPAAPTVIDVGCSSGYLLPLRAAWRSGCSRGTSGSRSGSVG